MIFFAFLAAFIYGLLANRRDILIAAKRPEQQTAAEQQEVAQGLTKIVFLNLFVFTPASVALMLLLLPLLERYLPVLETAKQAQPIAYYSAVGVVSYGFPFSTVRAFVVKWVRGTVQHWAESALKAMKEDRSEK